MMLGAQHTWRVHAHQGKRDLLDKLPGRLRGYAKMFPGQPGLRVVVLVDRDRADCVLLKKRLEEVAKHAGVPTRAVNRGNHRALNRIAIEELEAWLLGDIPALAKAYPRVPGTLSARAEFRDPDKIRNTWEKLEAVLQEHGYHLAGLPKITVARAVARLMTPTENRSPSFRHFRNGLTDLVGS